MITVSCQLKYIYIKIIRYFCKYFHRTTLEIKFFSFLKFSLKIIVQKSSNTRVYLLISISPVYPSTNRYGSHLFVIQRSLLVPAK